MEHIMKLIFLGPPGAGKGTQAKQVANEYRIAHISTGDMLRQAIAEGTELGKLAKSLIDHGNLVPDDVITEIVKSRLVKKDCSKGFILDGFPRTLPQAEELDQFESIDICIALNISDEIIVKRLVGRRNCPYCIKDFNVYFNPPVKDNICDICGKELNRRADDNEDAIKTRLKIYWKETQPLIDYYKNIGKLFLIDGTGSPEDVLGRIKSSLVKFE
jgi:adenylate kinase